VVEGDRLHEDIDGGRDRVVMGASVGGVELLTRVSDADEDDHIGEVEGAG
jgi:hypothetical protein